jgi:hypothetical protein
MGTKRNKKKTPGSADFDWFAEDDPVDESAVNSVAAKWGVKFPTKYVRIAAKYNGGCPDRDIFDVDGRPECVFDYLLTVPNGIVEWYDDTKDRLPDGVYPFATDPFGNAICFDYRTGPKPTIVFWDHEAVIDDPRQVLPIAESFTAFLKHLYEL